ncbi:MAG: sulfide/dihydroorotate dehydrogenase-like FAD/NAD-binding protein [Candidatus Omnitrophota bacterium]
MKITEKEVLSTDGQVRVVRMSISSPDIARRARPGQFVVLMVSDKGERIPLTIVESDSREGTVTIIFQEAGLSTRLLGKMEKGETLYALVGPLGHATGIMDHGKVIIIGGGVGAAEIYPVVKAFEAAGCHVATILGARTKGLLILEKELKRHSKEFYVTTDDGTAGRKGFTTDVLKELLAKGGYDLIYAVGPIPMMRKVAVTAAGSGVKTIVSLNALMVDATGMCGCCRVTVGGRTQFSCVDGPEFDAALVDWDELAKRNAVYCDKEKHICKLNNL